MKLDASMQLVWDLLRSMTSGVLLFDLDNNVVLVNPLMRTITGVYIGDAALRDYVSRFKKEIRGDQKEKGIDLEIAASRATNEGKAIFFKRVPYKDKVYETVVTPVRNEKREISGGAFIFHDITRIVEIDQLKSEFVSVASHQLRTPLTATRLFSEMLLDEEVGKLNNKQKEYVDAVYKSTNRMIALVEDLLNISRIETGRLKIEPVPTKIEELIKEVINDLGPVAKEKCCAISFNKPFPPLPEVPIDKKLLRQILSNLINNSIRYSNPKNCDILVELSKKTPTNYVLSVKDNGIGIPKEDQSRIFEKFFRTSSAVKTQAVGTGLGMYIAKMVIEAAGGNIWFESEDGKGTTFYVMIPVSGMKGQEGEKSLT
jgi:two-component system, NtrC family, sensor histidine kinase KinB